MSDPDPTDPGRTPRAPSRVQLRAGGASDVGRSRSVNQDSLLLGPTIYVVADGMGGHAAGEVASQIVVDSLDTQIVPTDSPRRVLDLVGAVQAANDTVWERSAADPALAGMGTTVVAVALVVEDGEERIAIVNVGDSRAYRLSQGALDQVSDDHSLVGELLREGRLTPEEARTHPQKNIVTRAIGIDEFVDVDEFQLLPRTGDRYLLCSDGLTDEVTEDEIAHVLRTVADPDEAAAELVAMANDHGGRDNITVVIVDVVDDAGAGTVDPRAALPDDENFSRHEDADTQTFAPLTDDELAGTTVGGGAGAEGTKTPRVVTVRSLAFVVAVLVVVGGGAVLAYNYALNTYFVTVDEGEVTIFRGRPGGVLWLDPSFVEGTDIDPDDVPAADLEALAEGVTWPSLSAARRYVDNLEERVADFTPPVSTTTTTRPRSTTTTTRTGASTSTTRPTTTTEVGP